jgi:hypothetical protein
MFRGTEDLMNILLDHAYPGGYISDQ